MNPKTQRTKVIIHLLILDYSPKKSQITVAGASIKEKALSIPKRKITPKSKNDHNQGNSIFEIAVG